MRRRLLIAAGLVAGSLAAPGLTAAHAAPPGCAQNEKPGGEWRSYGRDYSNTRHQEREKVLSPADAPLLRPAWRFSTVKQGEAEGDITGTPVVADGCVYVGTNRGWAFALNADTGALVWKAKVPYGGGINASAAVERRVCGRRKYRTKKGRKKYRKKMCGTVYFAASRTRPQEGCPKGDPCVGPYVIAFDQRTGRVAWATRSLDNQGGADVFGSPVIFAGTLLIGVSGGSAELGDEADRYAFQGSFLFLDANKGKVLRKTWTIHPPKQPEDDFAGAGIWSTPAVDPKAKVAYVGTANPFQPDAEHPYANSVVKYDVNRKSRRFGRIIGHYKGNVDEYFPGLSELECYDIPGNPPPYYPQGIGSCGDIDLDFGAHPNLFTGPDGKKLVGAGQKSGVYHVFEADGMKPVWNQIVGPPGSLGGIVGSTAHDGQSVYGPITVPGYIWSLSGEGRHRWVAPILDGAHWGPPVAVANGVVYSIDLTGFLDAFDARSGALLAKRPILLGGSGPMPLSWGGVSVARNTVYAATGIGSLSEGHLVAFRPGPPQAALEDLPGTVGGMIGGGGGGGGEGSAVGTAVVAAPGSTYTSYATPVMTTQVGGPLSFVNLDLPQHDVTADEKGLDGRPLFASRLGGLGEIVPVEGLEKVQSGKTYGFYCSIHPGMRGQLIVR
jgi:polyvinyl alcohol dehydrogenase (cytochrome)